MFPRRILFILLVAIAVTFIHIVNVWQNNFHLSAQNNFNLSAHMPTNNDADALNRDYKTNLNTTLLSMSGHMPKNNEPDVFNRDSNTNLNATLLSMSSHIPKSNETDARNRDSNTNLNTTLLSIDTVTREIDKLDGKLPKVFHYFLHIPKAGGGSGTQILNSDVKDMTNFRNRVCNTATSPLENWHEWEKEREKKRCIMFSSEGHYIPEDSMKYTSYTIVRTPVQHVLSMFFHCTEASVHSDRFKFMPSLDTWLETWIEAMRSGNTKEQNRLDKKYQCYNIINHQSTKLGLDHDPGNKEELKRRYPIVGITSSLAKSTCLVVIKVTGVVPPRCNCTNKSRNVSKQRRVTHGVKHHGSTFMPSPSQLASIKLLTEKDQILYENAKELFEEEVERVQREFAFSLCS
uniref:Sulfotransferase domain-containing protein n=1 Tax=Aplanochytrium stocchinoi TaxID=215587 RepID=A0A7S3LSR0_9STRA